MGALFQAAVLGVVYRKLFGRPQHRTRPSGAVLGAAEGQPSAG
ncbi:hypothetical protein [Streptomyces sp. NPDC058755]